MTAEQHAAASAWLRGWIRRGVAFATVAEPRAPLPARAFAGDVALAAALTVTAVATAMAQFPSWAAPLAVAMMAAPLAMRRRYPLTAFWIILAAVFADSHDVTVVTFVTVIFAAYCAVAYSRFHRAALLSLAAAATMVTAVFANTTPPLPGRFTALMVLAPTALVGNVVRTWRRQARDSQDRMRRLAAEHQAATLRALELERARIASELHDVVTHNVSVMVVQAGAARQVLASSPDDAREALLAVESSGRAAMTELRHLLGLLCPSGGQGEADAVLRPQPGLGQLRTLIDRVSAAGLPVESHISGTPCELPGGLDLAAYRVVQEALTNVIRHAGRARTDVRIDYRPGELVIEVADDGRPPADADEGAAATGADASAAAAATAGAPGPGAAAGGTGRGLLGLRERIALYGGDLDAGRRPGGGWRVRARIPVDVPAAITGARPVPGRAGGPVPARLP